MQWDFEKIRNRYCIENLSNIQDTVEGNYEEAPGISGKGLRIDGFTTRVIRKNTDPNRPGTELAIGVWVSLEEYTWNWCSVITTESDEVKGYRLIIDKYIEPYLGLHL